MKVLINIPSLSLQGGVANHYLGLKPYWAERIFYNVVGRRKFGSGFLWFPYDIIKFVLRILLIRPNLLLLNPSLALNATRRDLYFLKVSLYLNQKTLVFFHGWNETTLSDDYKNKLALSLNCSHGVIVLAEDFKTALLNWGVKRPIFLSTTKVDDRLITDFNPSMKSGTGRNLLFLSRIEFDKGVIIAIDTFAILKMRYTDLQMKIVGYGNAFQYSKEYIERLGIKDITFTGALTGDRLRQEFLNADLYILPTSHGEGIPTSVLEAMAFGLPVITRPVGGLKDFFLDGKMGYLVDSLEPIEFSLRAESLIESLPKRKEISLYNYNYAKEHFMASKVARDLEKIFNQAYS